MSDEKIDERVEMALIKQTLRTINTKIDKIDERLEGSYITKSEVEAKFKLFEEKYKLVRMLVFSAASTILGGFFVTLVYFIVNGHAR